MRTRTTLITDFSVGGVARTMIEAPAQEIDELYQQMVAGIVAAVPVSVYRSFNFGKLAAQAAGGLVRVQITPQPGDIVIAAGSVLTQPGSSVTFASTADCVITASNSYGDVPVVATTSGSATNMAVNTAFALASPPAGYLSASNLVAFINGRDLETDAEQKTRFNDFIATLPRGTPAACKYAALDKAFLTDANGALTERVAFCSVDEPYERDTTQPPGLVNVYVHNGVGATSGALVNQVGKVLYGYYDASGNAVPGYKAAGAHVVVYAATEVRVAVAAVLTAAPGMVKANLVTQAVDVIAAYITGLDIGATCIAARLVELVMDIPGVVNFVAAPALADTVSTYSTKLMPGAIAVT